jgi:hypothetical protein
MMSIVTNIEIGIRLLYKRQNMRNLLTGYSSQSLCSNKNDKITLRVTMISKTPRAPSMSLFT